MEPISNIISFEESSSPSSSTSSKPKLTDNIFELDESGGLLVLSCLGFPSGSTCGATTAVGVSASVSDSPCSNCSALTTSGDVSHQANAYGGSISVVFVGAYAWASSYGTTTCGATSASGVIVAVSDTPCSNCSALTTSGSSSYQANAYGGSMSVVHVGGSAWTIHNTAFNTTCGATSASRVSVAVSDTPCSNCSASTSSGKSSFQANAYGGSMSVVHVGGNAWNYVNSGSFYYYSRSHCDSTWVTDLSVFIADSASLLAKAFSSTCRHICVCPQV
jgi:hypothetical protein